MIENNKIKYSVKLKRNNEKLQNTKKIKKIENGNINQRKMNYTKSLSTPKIRVDKRQTSHQ